MEELTEVTRERERILIFISIFNKTWTGEVDEDDAKFRRSFISNNG